MWTRVSARPSRSSACGLWIDRMTGGPPPRTLYTVSALTALLRVHIESAFSNIWVEGEVSNLRIPTSGHAYFTLKDAASQMRAVLFRSVGRSLRFALQDGMQLVCRGRVTVYEPKGDYQVIVEYAEPKGVGALQLAFEDRKSTRLNSSHTVISYAVF